MKSNSLYAALFVVTALAASSAQALTPPATTTLSYGPDINPSGFYSVGDYIHFDGTSPFSLTEATFLLESNLSDPATLGLKLFIYDTSGTLLESSNTTSGTWSATSPFSYSFLFNGSTNLPQEIVYALSLTNDPNQDPVQDGNLKITLTSRAPSTGSDPAGSGLLQPLLGGSGLNLGVGEVIATSNDSVTQPISFNGGTDKLGIVAKFSTANAVIYESQPDQAVPEPATLALLSLGLAGLGYARRRKVGN